MSKPELLLRILFEMVLILAACRAVGFLVRKVGQPQVIGEMIAGVALGPTILGSLAPQAQAWAFPVETMPVIYCLSQIGVALYMFGQGLEFDLSLISRRSATAVSSAGILAPLAVGGAMGFVMVGSGGFFASGISSLQAALFMGAAMSITAFPVLARIIDERGLKGSRIGTLALGAGAINDAMAWCLLAVVLSTLEGSINLAALAFGGAAVYLFAIRWLNRAWLSNLAETVERKGDPKGRHLGTVFAVLMACACFTDFIGLHLLFGAFILGAAIPKGELNERLRGAVTPVSSALFVPLFFAYSGFNTKLALINSWELLGISLVVLLAATVAKAVACAVAARKSGLDLHDSLGIGALMNARGLMELLLINIALEAGMITPTLFAILSVMTIVTTFIATPAFELTRRRTGENLAMPITARTDGLPLNM